MKYPIMQSNRKPLINAQEYESMYEQSMSQPDEFWADQADQFISWDKSGIKSLMLIFLKGRLLGLRVQLLMFHITVLIVIFLRKQIR